MNHYGCNTPKWEGVLSLKGEGDEVKWIITPIVMGFRSYFHFIDEKSNLCVTRDVLFEILILYFGPYRF